MATSELQEKLIQPLPWRAERGFGTMGSIRDVNGFYVADYVTNDEADFIVKAVNHHDELVAMLSWLEWIDDGQCPRCGRTAPGHKADCALGALLAKVEAL